MFFVSKLLAHNLLTVAVLTITMTLPDGTCVSERQSNYLPYHITNEKFPKETSKIDIPWSYTLTAFTHNIKKYHYYLLSRPYSMIWNGRSFSFQQIKAIIEILHLLSWQDLKEENSISDEHGVCFFSQSHGTQPLKTKCSFCTPYAPFPSYLLLSTSGWIY